VSTRPYVLQCFVTCLDNSFYLSRNSLYIFRSQNWIRQRVGGLVRREYTDKFLHRINLKFKSPFYISRPQLWIRQRVGGLIPGGNCEFLLIMHLQVCPGGMSGAPPGRSGKSPVCTILIKIVRVTTCVCVGNTYELVGFEMMS